MHLLLALVALAAPSAPAPFDGQISGHGSHVCWLRQNHQVACWGLNLTHAPADAPSGEPGWVPGLNDAMEIAVGDAHACAIRSGGQVVCWGYNGLGQLGRKPEKAFQQNPQPIPGLDDASHIASAANRTCAARKSGAVVCWGSWDSNVARAPAPTQLPGIANAVALSMAEIHGCALLADGHVDCWGDDSRGELGDGRRDATRFGNDTPVQVAGLDDAVAISTARLDSCAVRQSGQVDCWGNRAGQFEPHDHPGPVYALSPVAIPGATGARSVMLTETGGCLIRAKDGHLACWWPPFQPWSQADFAHVNRPAKTPIEMKFPAPARAILELISAEESYALFAGGEVLHWGGRGARRPMAEVRGLTDAIAVSSGVNQSCAVRRNGTVWCWGAIGSGTESSGTFAPATSRFSSTAREVPKVKSAVTVAVGAAHACALDSAGGVWCWGSDAAGQLGNGKKGRGLSAAARARAKVSTPVPPPELMPREPPLRVKLPGKAVQIAAGGDSSCAVLSDGTIECWGANPRGQLGTGNSTASLSPSPVLGIKDGRRVVTDGSVSVALRADGTVACWGREMRAVSNANTTADALVPTPLLGVKGAVDIAVGGSVVCTVLQSGAAMCWGRRSRYLGDGDTAVHGEALATVAAADVRSISAGVEQRCVITTKGIASCWGQNDRGLVGDGTRVDRLAPKEVVGLGPVKWLSAGEGQTCAVRGNGHVVCWGAFDSGGLGDGIDPSLPRPLALELPTTPSTPAAANKP